MTADSVTYIFLNAAVVNNFVLAMFLGICPFLGVSAKRETALSMGLAVIFVMLVSSICSYGINWMLKLLEIEYLRLICYIAVIASAVQLVEMTMKKYSPALFRALGIFLPLITTNCAILGVALFQTSREYSFTQSIAFSLGAGVGFTIALMLMAGLRQHLEMAKVPSVSQGAALTMMLAGLLSLAFMGFAGLGAQHG
ncbi:MAG: RnfABCDGE type electron transport complex subunit A [Gammaproteobacteria bacterium]|jgi:electron transport complex protein RnfA